MIFRSVWTKSSRVVKSLKSVKLKLKTKSDKIRLFIWWTILKHQWRLPNRWEKINPHSKGNFGKRKSNLNTKNITYFFGNILIFWQNFDCFYKFGFVWPTFLCLMKMSSFNENFDVLWKFLVLMKISMFYENFYLLWKFRFLMKISSFNENFDVWWKFRFLPKISIFAENFDFCRKFRFLIKISTFEENFDFWGKFWFLMNISTFDPKCWFHFRFFKKNFHFKPKVWILPTG